MIRRGLAALALALLAGCADDDPSSGGGGFGGETIAGRVVDLAGAAVPHAAVRLRGSRSLGTQALYATSTDDSGRFSFGRILSQPLILEVAGLKGTDSVRALVDLDAGQSPGDVAVRTSPARSLRLLDSAGLPLKATLQCYGLGGQVRSSETGAFDLAGFPVSDLWLRVTPDDGRAASDLFVAASAQGDVQILSGWLVDDFESARTKTRLGLLTGGGWWYGVELGGDSAMSGTALQISVATLRDSTQSHGGKASLHGRFGLDSSKYPRFGVVGFHFGATRTTTVDLSVMDSVVLWTRGSGTVRAEFVVLQGADTVSYATSFTPAAGWGRIVLKPADLLPVSGTGTWKQASRQAYYLQFIVFDSADFWLDDLRLFASRLP